MNSVDIAYIFLCVAVGVAIAFQALLNASLGAFTRLNSFSALMSFVVGFPVVIVYFLVESQQVDGKYARAPWWSYLGGLLGAFYIVSVILTVRRLGAGVVLSVLVASQVIASVTIDHFGVLDVVQRDATPGRIVGVALITVGAVLISIY